MAENQWVFLGVRQKNPTFIGAPTTTLKFNWFLWPTPCRVLSEAQPGCHQAPMFRSGDKAQSVELDALCFMWVCCGGGHFNFMTP